jgi:DMSO/TMAO reductase YedYZ molybdopterin-dependent catalytic subunit
VLAAGPTPYTRPERWDLGIHDEGGQVRRWRWEEFRALPREALTVDIHCVTKWSKFDTRWEGVAIDTLLRDLPTTATHVLAMCDGGSRSTCRWRTS